MTKPKKIKAKMGCPTKYKEDYARQAYVACAEGGFTERKLAKLFGVNVSTVKDWKVVHPNFSASIVSGRDIYDNANVEKCLLRRAMGYTTTEVVKVLDPATNLMTATKKVTKEVVPDVKAQTFWLRNRNRERWPDTQKLDGNLAVTMTHEEMLDELE